MPERAETNGDPVLQEMLATVNNRSHQLLETPDSLEITMSYRTPVFNNADLAIAFTKSEGEPPLGMSSLAQDSISIIIASRDFTDQAGFLCDVDYRKDTVRGICSNTSVLLPADKRIPDLSPASDLLQQIQSFLLSGEVEANIVNREIASYALSLNERLEQIAAAARQLVAQGLYRERRSRHFQFADGQGLWLMSETFSGSLAHSTHPRHINNPVLTASATIADKRYKYTQDSIGRRETKTEFTDPAIQFGGFESSVPLGEAGGFDIVQFNSAEVEAIEEEERRAGLYVPTVEKLQPIVELLGRIAV